MPPERLPETLTQTPPEALAEAPVLTIILPACNEQGVIRACLDSLLGADWVRAAPVEIIVAANNCSDDTVPIARGYAAAFEARGWRYVVLDRAEGGKTKAQNAAERLALSGNRLYLDADIVVAPGLLAQIVEVLDVAEPRFASGTINMVADTVAGRTYARFWRELPYMRQDVPGCGLFAVNAAGRARFGEIPEVMAEDLYVRLNFAPEERHVVPATYDWPLPHGAWRLFLVRRRQNVGVRQVLTGWPDLLRNERTRDITPGLLARLVMRAPLGFLIYGAVGVGVRLFPARSTVWTRGR